MPSARSSQPSKKKTGARTGTVIVRLDDESKACLSEAAGLRGISVSDYVRTVAVAQARREALAARESFIALSPEGQLAFWKALNQTPKLTTAQRRLGSLMRGES
jgi:uncharacterized protein (DUF1778 family)